MGFRVNHSHPPSQKHSGQPPLKGVSRLVNPPDDGPEVVAAEEDKGERDYLGRLLRVGDEALRQSKGKRTASHRHKRSRIH